MRKPTMTMERLSRQQQPLATVTGAALAVAAGLMLGASPADAEGQGTPQCAAREAVLERLSAQYKEEPVSLGVTATGSLLEVLASPEGGTWTIIITVPGGPTCLVSSGEGWRGAPVQVAHEPGV